MMEFLVKIDISEHLFFIPKAISHSQVGYSVYIIMNVKM